MPTTPYITVDDMRAYLDQTKAGAEQDATLTSICARATSIVNGALGFVYAGYAAGIRPVHASGTAWLYLPPYEPGSVTSVVWGSYTVPSDDYYEDSERSALVRTNTTILGALPYSSWDSALYSVAANYGYGPPPESIVEVTLEVAMNIWRSRARGGFTELVGAEGGGAVRSVQGLTKQQQAIVEAEKARFRGPLAI